MERMFKEDQADFSSMTSFPNIFVSKVFQKSIVEVNEMGTEAASASGMTTVMKLMPTEFK